MRLAHGDWRSFSRAGLRAGAARARRDPKNPSHRRRVGGGN
jgi:hypothetical protein